MYDKNVLEAMLACFYIFRFGPTWEGALCIFEQNCLEAMLACSGVFCFGLPWEGALCMFEQNGLEACFALAERGKRLCACLIKTVWKR